MTQESPAHPARSHRYITTFSGQRIDSKHVTPDQIVRTDCTRGLAMQTRYQGQIRDFYSIAEHSILVSRIAEHKGHDLPLLQAALLHDGHEYLSGDFPSPYKYDVPGLRTWERGIESAFRESMGLPGFDDPIWTDIKHYDLIALHFEANNLMAAPPDWIDHDLLAQAPKWLEIRCHNWEMVASLFRSRSRQLALEGF